MTTPIRETDDDGRLVRGVEEAMMYGSRTPPAQHEREASPQGAQNSSPYLLGMPTPIVSTRAGILRRIWRPSAIALSLVGSSALCAMGGGLAWMWKIDFALHALVGLWLAVAAVLNTVRTMALDRELKREFDAASRMLLGKLESAPQTMKGERVTAQTIANLERLQALREKVGTRGS